MREDSYPSLYRYADAASLEAQRVFLILHKTYLLSLVLASAISTSAAIIGARTAGGAIYAALAVVLVIGFLTLWVMRARQDDKVWFDGRAVAESVKTATWRFMMRVHPFHEQSHVETAFIAGLKEIREARPHLGRHLAAAMDPAGSSITGVMTDVRASSWDERRQLYAGTRIRGQRLWYLDKARANVASGARWFWTIVALQVVIATCAIVQAVSGGLWILPIPIITTSAAAITAWNQTRRHDELAQSYALAAQELEEIEAMAMSVSEDEFPQLVEQAEESISREHTMWCARRDVRLSKTGSGAGQGRRTANEALPQTVEKAGPR